MFRVQAAFAVVLALLISCEEKKASPPRPWNAGGPPPQGSIPPAQKLRSVSMEFYNPGLIRDYCAVKTIDILNGLEDVTKIDFKVTCYNAANKEIGSRSFSVGDGTKIIIPREQRAMVYGHQDGMKTIKPPPGVDIRIWLSPQDTQVQGQADRAKWEVLRVDTIKSGG